MAAADLAAHETAFVEQLGRFMAWLTGFILKDPRHLAHMLSMCVGTFCTQVVVAAARSRSAYTASSPEVLL